MIPLLNAGIAPTTSVVSVTKLYIHLKMQYYVI